MTRSSLVLPVSEEDWRVRRAFKIGEVAWLLGLSYDVTLAEVRAGRMGARRVGKYHVIPREEIERYMAEAVKDRSADLVKVLSQQAKQAQALKILSRQADQAQAVIDALELGTTLAAIRDAS